MVEAGGHGEVQGIVGSVGCWIRLTGIAAGGPVGPLLRVPVRAPTPITRVLLIDGHATYRSYLRNFLEKHLRLQVVGEAGDADAALRLLDEAEADAALVDVGRPGDFELDGIEITRRIVATRPALKVIALSLYEERQFADALLQAGASAFVIKDDAVDQLPSALRTVAAGRVYRAR